MPDIFYALQRFKSLALPLDQQKTHISALLKSTTWGGRWAGAYWVHDLMTPMDVSDLKRLSQEERERKRAAYEAARAMGQAFAKDIIELLSDPHPFVRTQAAQCMVQYGESAKPSIPQLVALLKDVDGQTWYTRLRSLEALMVMPLDEETKQTVEITALGDPNSYVRRAILDRTFQSGDKATVAKTAQAYKSVLIQQVFDAPHGMATPGDRSKLAKTVVDQLAKEDILPSLPRFLDALKQPGGGTAHGSMAILASLGGEVVDELKVLAADKDQTVRINALETLLRIALSDAGSPELIAFVKHGLESEDVPERSWLETRIKRLLKRLDQPAEKKN